ncbi:MAG TPA: hypothetical protein PKB10_09875, partial [Tepidisphaeraceae bacterium]|nr:hypothetical protein [Tepidisphaeraceae bacterium]
MSQPARFWENPRLFEIHRLPARSYFIPRAPGDPVDYVRPQISSRARSLSGDWRFALSNSPDEAPAGFESVEFDDASWSSIAVPGHWQLQGFGKPHYTNVQYPFPVDPPFVPTDNPTGHYRRPFELNAAELRDRTHILRFEGVDSCFNVWINGRHAGLSKGSRLPAEFDVSAFVRAGTNVIVVQVVQWSDASYMEDQDMWWLSGIFRDVWLIARPKTHVFDIGCTPSLAGSTGKLKIAIEMNGATDGWTLRGTLRDRQAEVGKFSSAASATINATIHVANVPPWTAETPSLHQLSIELRDPAGQVAEVISLRTGFREVTIADAQLRVNGTKVMFRGVNRH